MKKFLVLGFALSLSSASVYAEVPVYASYSNAAKKGLIVTSVFAVGFHMASAVTSFLSKYEIAEMEGHPLRAVQEGAAVVHALAGITTIAAPSFLCCAVGVIEPISAFAMILAVMAFFPNALTLHKKRDRENAPWFNMENSTRVGSQVYFGYSNRDSYPQIDVSFATGLAGMLSSIALYSVAHLAKQLKSEANTAPASIVAK